MKDAKQKLNQASEEVVNKIENKKKEIKEIQSNLVNDPEPLQLYNIENIKSKYDEAIVALELRKNKIEKKIDAYNKELKIGTRLNLS